MGRSVSGGRLRALFSAHDLTAGPPWKRILELAIPMLLGNLAQQLYNTADAIIVGRYIGDNALAAVGSAGPILNLMMALFVGVAVGVGILVSQFYGARQREQLSQVIGNCITLSLLISLITIAAGTFFIRPLLELLETPPSILEWCHQYLMIFIWGVAGFALYNILSGILRGLGDSVSALLFLLVSAALNVGMDIWFVTRLNMGVPGVALATVLAQSFSALLCLGKLMSMKNIFHLQLHHLSPRPAIIRQIFRMGIPSGITQAIFGLAMIVVQALTNSFGETVIACNVVVMRVDGFAMMPNFTFGQSMTTFTGQNTGAKKPERVHEGARQGTLIAVGTSIVLTLCILFFGRGVVGFFSETEALGDMAMHMMRILSLGYIAMSVTQSLCGVMRGAGDTMTPMWISITTAVILRVPLAYAIAALSRSPEWPNGRPESIFISLVIAWTLGALISIFFYRRGRWHKKLESTISGQTPIDPGECP